jgi:ribonuclease HII
LAKVSAINAASVGLNPTVAALLAHLAPTQIAGFDEVGRGPLAGPVVAACAILPLGFQLAGITDSKALSPAKREALYPQLLNSVSWGAGWVWPTEIEALNIHHASLEAMARAWTDCCQRFPQAVAAVCQGISDGKFCPPLPYACAAQVKGDLLVPAISAASIIAKVQRDNYMIEQDKLYPAYGFAGHKGYPSPAHRTALMTHGPCPIHRMAWVEKFVGA